MQRTFCVGFSETECAAQGLGVTFAKVDAGNPERKTISFIAKNHFVSYPYRCIKKFDLPVFCSSMPYICLRIICFTMEPDKMYYWQETEMKEDERKFWRGFKD